MKNGPLRGCFISPTMSTFMLSFSPVRNGVTPFISSSPRRSSALATCDKGGPAPRPSPRVIKEDPPLMKGTPLATCDKGGLGPRHVIKEDSPLAT